MTNTSDKNVLDYLYYYYIFNSCENSSACVLIKLQD